MTNSDAPTLAAVREQWETNGHLTDVQQEWLLTEVDRLTRERDDAREYIREYREGASESYAEMQAQIDRLTAERYALAALVVEACGLLKLLDRKGEHRAIDDYLDRAKCAEALVQPERMRDA